MKNLLNVLIFFSGTTILAQAKPVAVKEPAQKINQTDAKGKKQGVWQKNYDKSKAIVYRGQFLDDKPVGTFYYYYPSTKLKIVIVHDDKSDRSSATMFHENKNIMAKGIYRGELKDSVWSFYDETGRITSSDTYSKGVLNGMRYVYFIPNAVGDKTVKLAKQWNYVNGNQEGEYIEYFDNGVIKGQGNYLHGHKHGRCVTNYTNGKPMVEERFNNGKKHGFQRAYNEQGKELGNRYFRYGQEIKGTTLTKLLADMKKRNVNPNE